MWRHAAGYILEVFARGGSEPAVEVDLALGRLERDIPGCFEPSQFVSVLNANFTLCNVFTRDWVS